MTVKHKANLMLEKYEMTDDLTNIEVLRRRGLITDTTTNKVVCRGFDKFFNWNEPYAATIDWTRPIQVTEKIDGTNIRLYHYNGEWHIATLGNIDAADAVVGEFAHLTFADLVVRAVGGSERLRQLEAILDPAYTWIFELVAPESRVVVDYRGTILYYLGNRENSTFYNGNAARIPAKMGDFVKFPRTFTPRTLEEARAIVAAFDVNHEGIVVSDNCGNMVKIKGQEYLAAAKLNNNGHVTLKRVIEMWHNNTLDDFMAYCPQYQNKIQAFLQKINELSAHFDSLVVPAERLAILKEAKENQDYLFKKFAGKVADGTQYVKMMPAPTLHKLLTQFWIDIS